MEESASSPHTQADKCENDVSGYFPFSYQPCFVPSLFAGALQNNLFFSSIFVFHLKTKISSVVSLQLQYSRQWFEVVSFILAMPFVSVNTSCLNDKRKHLYSTKNIFYMGSVSSWRHFFKGIFVRLFQTPALKIHFDTNDFNKMQNVHVHVSLCAFTQGQIDTFQRNISNSTNIINSIYFFAYSQKLLKWF